VLLLHGGEGRGNNDVKPVTNGNEKRAHVWISSEVPSKFPAFVLARQCPWERTGPTRNSISQPTRWHVALEILASVEKQFTIEAHLCGPIDGRIRCVVAAANASGKMGGRGGSGGLR
jgi:hypothetical protein